MLVDTHCHLDAQYFPDGPDPVLDRARTRGVGAFVCIGVGGVEAARGAVELAGRRSDVFATVGTHPHDASRHRRDAPALLPLLDAPRVVALGEIGLDYHYDHSLREDQQQVFRELIAVARERSLPIVVHTRSAAADTLSILREERAKDVGGVIHCFSEDWTFACAAFDLGFFVSFSGIVTFKKAEAVREVARRAPADRYLVETDSPYLAPVPHRGKPNEPAYVEHTAAVVAELRGVDRERVGEETTRNAVELFSMASPAP